MTRDYARSTRGRKQSNHKASHGIVWFILGGMLVLLIFGLNYLARHHHATQHPAHQAKSHKHKTSVVAKHERKPQFEFYNILTKEQPETSELPQKKSNSSSAMLQQATTPSVSPSLAPVQAFSKVPPTSQTQAKNNKPSSVYVLQVASFSRYEDADQLKARLILEGYTSNIEETKYHNQTWYRVKIGPYRQLAIAKQVQQRLQQERLKVILNKVG